MRAWTMVPAPDACQTMALQASQASSPVARLQAEVTRLAQHAQRKREVGLRVESSHAPPTSRI